MAEQRFDEVVPEALDGQRVDRVVAIIADASRRQAGQLVADGGVEVDGQVVDKPSIKLDAGQSIRFDLLREEHSIEPDPLVDVPVLHADDQVIVVDKPAGLVVHPGSGVRGSTMVNGLLARFPDLLGVGQADRPGIVHRLDRGTSGLLVVARSAGAYDSLVAQLAARTVERRYRTLVAGHLESDAGLIDAPLGRSPRQATIRAVMADGRPARTRYEVRERLLAPGRSDGDQAVTHLSCRLETGRTHQIRAHLAAIGHPVVGDVDYGGPALSGRPDGHHLRRPFLHAEELSFEHPTTGRRLTFTAPLPADLADVLRSLRATYDETLDGG